MRQIISTLSSAVIFTYYGVSAISTVLKTIILRSPSLHPSPAPLYIIIPTTELINTIGCFFALLSKLYYCTFYIQYSSTFSTSSLTSSTSTTSSTSLKSLTSTFLYLFSLLLCHPLPLLLLLLLPLIQRLFRSSKADHTKP